MLDELVTELAKARHEAAVAKSNLAAIHAQMASEFGGAIESAQGALNVAKERVEMLESNARTVAVSEFQRTGSKKPHKALSVGVYETMEYDDSKAIVYCMSHEIVAALKLDKKKFEGVAKALRPEFVTFDTEARGRIASDLEEWR